MLKVIAPEVKKEWEVVVGSHEGIPVILRKEDVRVIITYVINGASASWCALCATRKTVPVPESSEYEREAENLANGGELDFYMIDPMEDDENGKPIEKYTLTLDKFIEGIKKYLEPPYPEDLVEVKGDKANLNLTVMDGWIEDGILQTALFGDIVLD